MSLASLRSLIILITGASLFAGCGSHPPMRPFFQRFAFFGPQGDHLEEPPANRPENFWADHDGKGAPFIRVRLGTQGAYFYRGRKIVGATKISTGKKGFGTPVGSYSVIQRDKHHVSTLYGDFVDSSGAVVQANVDVKKDSAPAGAVFRGAKMPYFLRFQGGHGLHAGRVPNHPASHGCVRLPSDMARHFFENAPLGTPVLIEN